MDKLENLKKLKQLFDDGVLSEKEFHEMKMEILSTSNIEMIESNNPIAEQKKELDKKKDGSLTLSFGGKWYLFEIKTKLFVNNELHSTLSTNKGFSVKIPITDESMILMVSIQGFKTSYLIEELNKGKDYLMELSINRISGTYSEKFKFSENG